MEHGGTRQGLEWLLTEVEACLKEACDMLEEYLADTSGSSEHLLEACEARIHQVHGSLKLLEYSGPVLLAEEMEQLIGCIRSGATTNTQEACEVLVESFLQLPAYLRQMLVSGSDRPETLILLLNEVRAVRQQPLVTETSFFSPDLQGGIISQVTPRQIKEETFRELIVKLRQMYQHAVVGVVKNQKVEQNLGYLTKVFSRLHDISLGTTKEPLWKIMLALLESLADHSLSKGMAVRNLLRRMDNEFAQLYERGFAQMLEPVEQNLLKNLLFYVAWGKSEQQNAIEVREQYKLDSALPEAVIREQGEGLSALFDPETAKALVEAINVEVTQVKECLERFVVESGDLALLEKALESLKRTGDSLAVAGRNEQRLVMEQACQQLQESLLLPEDEIRERLKSVADLLVRVENGLYAWLRNSNAASDDVSMETDAAQDTLVNEIKNGLEAVKEAVVEFIASGWDVQMLTEVPAKLIDISGALGILGQSRAAVVMDACRQFLDEQLQVPESNWDKLDNFADAVTSVEYYLDFINREDTGNASEVLASAEKSIAVLGHEIARPAVIVEAPIISESPEAAEPTEDAAQTEALTLEPVELSQEVVLSQEEEPVLPGEASDSPESESVLQEEELSLINEEPALPDIELALPEEDLTLQEEGLTLQEEPPEEPPTVAEEPLLELQVDSAPEIEETRQQQPTVVEPESSKPQPKEREVDDEIVEIFLEEAAEVMEEIDRLYPQWVSHPGDLTYAQEIRRSFHTLKGSGRMVGADEIGELAWAVENLLNRMLDKRIEVNASIIALVDLVKEQLPDMAEAFKLQQPFARADLAQQLISSAEALARGEDALQLDTAAAAEPPEPEFSEPELSEPEFSAPESSAPESSEPESSEPESSEPESSEPEPLALEPIEPELSEQEDNLEQALSVEAAQQLAEAEAQETDREALQEAPQVESEQDTVLSIFASEAVIHLAALEAFIAEQQRQAPVYEIPEDSVYRALHTLRGSANMAGIASIGQLVTPLERFFIELRDHQIEVDREILALLIDTVGYVRNGLAQISANQPVTIDDMEPFLSRLAEVRLRTVGNGEVVEQSPREERIPLKAFMAEGAQQLLEVEPRLSHWREQPQNGDFVAAVMDELQTLAEVSNEAGIEQLEMLASRLLESYRNITENGITLNDEIIDVLLAAHQEVLNQLDCVAAAQDPEPLPTTLLEQLDAIVALPKPEPVATFHFDMRPIPEITEIDASDVDRDILETFAIEARELLEDIDSSLSRWRESFISGTADATAITALKRHLHTLKGGARMVGLTQLGEFSHELESDIISLENQGVGANKDLLSEEIFNYLLKQQDLLQRATEQAEKLLTESPQKAVKQTSSETVDDAEGREKDDTEVENEDLDVAASLPQLDRQLNAAQEMIRISTNVLEKLVNLSGETSIASGRIEAQISEFSFALEEMDATIRRLQDQVRRIGVETDAQMMFRREQIEASATVESFDPLEMDRYSQLQQLSRGLLESASDLQDLKDTLINKARDAETLLLEQSRINADLQESMMRTRMVPFSRIVPRLRRIVRQVADEVGKQVTLTLKDADGEMDRSVMEQMIAPLEHMIRNAIDHGIEDADIRDRLGKPVQGNITVSLMRQGGDILIQLADDGRGFDVEAIRNSAIKKGLMEQNAKLGDDEIIQFVFAAGFSTSSEVTQVSGRGVGMDVVNHQVRSLGGSIDIDTVKNRGSRFTIRLPFTVSVNRALMVGVAEDLYAIPLNSIDGVVSVTPAELENYYRYPESRLEYAGQDYEVCYLGNLLSEDINPWVDDTRRSIYLILVHSEKRNFAVQVDELLNNSEIVVKSIGPQFSAVPGLSGATLLGDGRVVVILDLMGLLRTRTVTGQSLQLEGAAESAGVESAVPTIMVVDDSVTVRKVAGRFLEREGFNVLTAKNGVEAMKLLQDHQPDVMLLDIEMPLMDGFEVATRVKTTGQWKDIPIIMITSRTGGKHKERAMSLGVERYLGKPYQEEELLANINELVGVVA